MNNRSAGYFLVVTATFFELFFFGNMIQSGKGFQFLSYPTLFGGIGFIMLFWGIAILASCGKSELECHMREIRKAIGTLKETGERIKVDLSKCTIKENNYTQEPGKQPQKSGFWGDVISGYEIRAMYLQIYSETSSTPVEVNQSVIIFEHEHNGKSETFVSSIINKDKATLMFLLDAQKETWLYVDKSDRSKYYFDLEFLFN